MADPKSPFASLEKLKASLPEGERAASKPAAAEPKSAPDRFEAKVVVAKSRKGRGGKTVTLVSGVRAAFRDETCGALKKALGTGATVEDDAIVVQGEQAGRIRAWLEAAGAKKIVMGT
jgi:translation initiation factor 1